MFKHIFSIPMVRRVYQSLTGGYGSVEFKTKYDLWEKPAYAYGMMKAAEQCHRLGYNKFIAIEFGVAGGNGLLEMEKISHRMEEFFNIGIDVVGFDSGSGMPSPRDYRDLPYVWEESFYKMDKDLLESRLTSAKLVLGPVKETTKNWLDSIDHPIGFISFDLDYYSSTKEAFEIFTGPDRTRLPRLLCYFDDTISPERAMYSEFTGELFAINEYNVEHEVKKISKYPYLHWRRDFPDMWNDQIYVHHDFKHMDYSKRITHVGTRHEQLPLSNRQ